MRRIFGPLLAAAVLTVTLTAPAHASHQTNDALTAQHEVLPAPAVDLTMVDVAAAPLPALDIAPADQLRDMLTCPAEAAESESCRLCELMRDEVISSGAGALVFYDQGGADLIYRGDQTVGAGAGGRPAVALR